MALHAGRRHPVQDAPTGHALGVLQLKVGASLEAVGPCQAGGGYNREMNEKRGASGPEQSVSDQAEIELFGKALTAEIDGLKNALSAKIDGLKDALSAEIDGLKADLSAKIDGVEKELTAKIDRFWTDLKAEIKGVRTDLKAEIATRAAEMKAIKRELAFIRWLLIILIAFLTLLVAYGLIPKFDRWPWQDATPEQSTSTPVASDPTQPGVPPEPDLQEPSPPE